MCSCSSRRRSASRSGSSASPRRPRGGRDPARELLLAALAAFALLAGYATGRLAPTAAYVLGAGLATLVLVAYADVHAFGYAESALERRAIPKSQSTSRTTIER
ncbi:hypothetical protein [Halalkalicoccus salilacus]|uniref:hypothetical protein n=1 Tax=Halalkalicoccus sp. GCM10025704 TaxID=3252662 RepID=UPI00360DE45F